MSSIEQFPAQITMEQSTAQAPAAAAPIIIFKVLKVDGLSNTYTHIFKFRSV
jgi:hypothetical protein